METKQTNSYQLITILGPTASGKTAFAAALAERMDTEIISGDSRQIYRSMDIGTGKDLADYVVNGKNIPYHLIDIHDPGYKYNVFEYQHDFHKAFDLIKSKGKLPILCGGTGMYIEAVLKGFKLLDVPQNPTLRESLKGKSLDELEQILASYKTLHNKTDVDSAQRAIRAIEIEEFYKTQAPDRNEYEPINSLIIGIDIDRDTRREKISKRLRARLEEGMVDEVQRILATGVKPEDLIYYGLEYKFLTLYVTGQLPYNRRENKYRIRTNSTIMTFTLDNLRKQDNFFLMAGPCVIENEDMALQIAEKITDITSRLNIPYIFKGSYRKANRSRLDSFTGIGDEKALRILRKVSETFRIPTVTDIHETHEAETAAAYVDVLQIPAFLCRQTDLLVAAARTGKIVNIKKGQFLSPEAIRFAAQKVADAGNDQVMLTERGTTFGYTDLVVDFRGIPLMRQFGYPVVMDATHSLQQPNQTSGVTGGMPALIETIAKAAIAVGADGLFIETHPNPSAAKSDGANMLQLDRLEALLKKLVRLREALQ